MDFQTLLYQVTICRLLKTSRNPTKKQRFLEVLLFSSCWEVFFLIRSFFGGPIRMAGRRRLNRSSSCWRQTFGMVLQALWLFDRLSDRLSDIDLGFRKRNPWRGFSKPPSCGLFHRQTLQRIVIFCRYCCNILSP